MLKTYSPPRPLVCLFFFYRNTPTPNSNVKALTYSINIICKVQPVKALTVVDLLILEDSHFGHRWRKGCNLVNIFHRMTSDILPSYVFLILEESLAYILGESDDRRGCLTRSNTFILQKSNILFVFKWENVL